MKHLVSFAKIVGSRCAAYLLLILLFSCSSFIGNVARFRLAGTSQTFREIGYQQLTLQPNVPNVGSCRGMKH